MTRNAILVIVALLFAGIGAYVGYRHQGPPPSLEPKPPTLLSRSMPDAAGNTQPLSKWKGKPLVVNFWAPWCAPCVEEMPELSELQKQVEPTGIQIIGIGIDSQANIAAFATKYDITYPLYVGGMEATELARQLGNQSGGLPFTVLIGADGTVRKTYLGRLKMDQLRNDLGLIKS